MNNFLLRDALCVVIQPMPCDRQTHAKIIHKRRLMSARIPKTFGSTAPSAEPNVKWVRLNCTIFFQIVFGTEKGNVQNVQIPLWFKKR